MAGGGGRGRSLAARVRPSAVAGAVVLLTAAVALVGRAEVLVHQCVAGDGMAGWLGLRLALLRADVDCPSGTLAVGADGRHVAGLLVVVALPVLLAHLAVAATGLAVLAALRGAVRAVVEAVGALVRRVPRPVRVLVVRARAAVAVVVRRAVAATGRGGVLRRGPPVLAPA